MIDARARARVRVVLQVGLWISALVRLEMSCLQIFVSYSLQGHNKSGVQDVNWHAFLDEENSISAFAGGGEGGGTSARYVHNLVVPSQRWSAGAWPSG